MILSHHGQLEFGSPKVPQFPEALLLHYLDDLDSKMECMRALIENDRQVEGCFTIYSSALERTALKKDRFWNGGETLAVQTEARLRTFLRRRSVRRLRWTRAKLLRPLRRGLSRRPQLRPLRRPL